MSRSAEETLEDPAYIVRENLILKHENNVLLRECERLAAQLGLHRAETHKRL
jgi:hypothetical protein